MTKAHGTDSDRAEQRRTQGERSSRTRRLICEATLDALAEVSIDKVSTSFVAERAKVSRGALTHQFPTRNEMFVAAYAYLLDSWRQGYPFGTGPDYVRLDFDTLIDALWTLIFDSRWYTSAIELMLASTKDDALGKELRGALDAWTRERDAAVTQILGIGPEDQRTMDLVRLSLSVLRGISLFRALSGTELAMQQLQDWKAIAGKAQSADTPPLTSPRA